MTPKEAEAALGRAQAGVARLLRADPKNEALLSVQRQLAQVAAWTRGGQLPTVAQAQLLSFGLIAAREIEPVDLSLATELHELSYYLKRGG
jgi:hypothetical protein